MKSFYDFEIFHKMLDGIDLDDHVAASYCLKGSFYKDFFEHENSNSPV